MVKSKNAYVLEDASQALLSKHVGQFSDFIIFSPKKFIGIPDGGILCSRCNVSIDNITLKPIPQSHWLKMLEASINRREFDQFGGEKRWFRLFQECERTNLPGYFAMSDLSRNLLFYAFDYTQIAERRINNYLLLSHKLENLGIFDSLQKDTVPLGFVIRHQKQPSIRQYLFKKHIYPPVHWLLEGFVPKKYKDSHLLANQIMTLPCDQRYRSKDMSVLISNLLKILKQEESNIPW
jgi:dTDP-4-amino-4,6-dideoxygalactose transaminase